MNYHQQIPGGSTQRSSSRRGASPTSNPSGPFINLFLTGKVPCWTSGRSLPYKGVLKYREEKSLRHVALVAKFLDDSEPIKSLKSLFALLQTSPIFFSFIYIGRSWRNFLWDSIYRYLSLKKESENFCVVSGLLVVFSYSIGRAREIRKFHVVVVQRRLLI